MHAPRPDNQLGSSHSHSDIDEESPVKTDSVFDSSEPNAHRRHRLSIRERLRHFTWAWFTLPMSCGGLSLLIFMQPHQFPGLLTIGTVVYSINIVIFCLVCVLMMYAHMVGRLMQSGLPGREHRPALFMCVGPPAFTALALIGMSAKIPETVSETGSLTAHVGTVRTVALLAAMFLWTLSLWWFMIAVIAVALAPPQYFHLGGWAMVFPNTGFTLATISIGNALENSEISWVATAMSVGVIIVFFCVLSWHVRAVWIQDIMYPGRDEDMEDH